MAARPVRLFLERGWDGEPPDCYLATVDGTPVGDAFVFYSERDNTHLAWLWLAILPEHRRRGYGTVLFEHVVAEVRALGRTSVGTDGWESERALGFAARHGLEKKSQAIMRRQHLVELEPGQLQQLYDEARRRRGRLRAGADHRPHARRAGRGDGRAGRRDQRRPDRRPRHRGRGVLRRSGWPPTRRPPLARGSRLYRLVARHKETGELGGHTVIAVEEQRPEIGDQHDTAVAQAHRGHRLGLLLKAGMLLWLAEAEPQLATVDTWNAESNDHMIARQRGARLPGDGPRAAVPEVAGHRAVSTSGPSSVIAMVCSMWAPREPSALRSVQPSGSVKISSVVCRNHGSIAITSPGLQREPAAGAAVVGHVRVAVHRAADAVAAELRC